MALSKKDRNLISGQFLVSKKFRAALLKNPTKAAATLGITLTKAQHQEILDAKDRWVNAATRADQALRGGLVAGIVPVFIMD